MGFTVPIINTIHSATSSLPVLEIPAHTVTIHTHTYTRPYNTHSLHILYTHTYTTLVSMLQAL